MHGGFVGENDRADAVGVQHPAAFGKGARHGVFKESTVFDSVAAAFGLVLHDLALFWRERIRRGKIVAQERMPRQRALQPDQKEVGQISVRNRVVIGRVGEPNTAGSIGEWMVGGIGGLDLAGHRLGRCRDDAGDPVYLPFPNRTAVTKSIRLREVPYDG